MKDAQGKEAPKEVFSSQIKNTDQINHNQLLSTTLKTIPNMAFGRRTRRTPGGSTVTTTTTTVEHPPEAHGRRTRAVGTKPSMKQRLFGPRTPRTTRATAAPTTRRRVGGRRTPATATTTPRRKTSVSDKVSGAMLKLKGTITRRPGQKAAGTRRMHGTDGRGTHRRYY